MQQQGGMKPNPGLGLQLQLPNHSNLGQAQIQNQGLQNNMGRPQGSLNNSANGVGQQQGPQGQMQTPQQQQQQQANANHILQFLAARQANGGGGNLLDQMDESQRAQVRLDPAIAVT